MKPIKIAVTGAAGRVGQAFLFQWLTALPFGKESSLDLRLLEKPEKVEILQGIRMELEDYASPLLANVFCTDDEKEAFRDIDWAVLIGSAPRKKGMERSDLLKINSEIFSKQGRTINEYAASSVRILVVGNPCNTNCLMTIQHAPDVPRDRFYAMTLLDELRAKAQLALKAGISSDEIQTMNVWGNHSATLYPDFYHATIRHQPALDIIKDERWLQNDFIQSVQQRGAEILNAQGISAAASAAHATLKTLNYLVHDTEKGQYFTLAKPSEGEYGIDKGLIFSFPCYIKQGKVLVAEHLEHSDFSKQKIQLTLEELRKEQKQLFTETQKHG